MYRGLIDHLAFVYGYICKGRGKLSPEAMTAISQGAHTLTANAPAVLGDGAQPETDEDRKDLAEAQKMDVHIDEMVVFLSSMEIC